MSSLDGKRVALDIDSLQQLCEQCMRDIDAQEEALLQQAMRKVCDSCVEAQQQLAPLQNLRKAVSRHTGMALGGQH